MNILDRFKRKTVLLGLAGVMAIGLGAAAGQNLWAKNGSSSKSYHIITATDLHYLSPRINDKGETLLKLSSKGDGKVVPYSGEIVDAFIEQVIAAKPDLLILTGDLTYNGEAASHEDLVKLLQKVESQGIEVLVIPGNHDISIPFAYSFSEGFAWETNSVTYPEFYQMYNDFGPGEARLKDPTSFSYVKEVSDKLWITLIDANTQQNSNRISRETLSWLETVLSEAKSRGVTVITGTHQDVLVHNERFNDGYLIDNYSELKTLLEKYGVRYNMAGHIHIQNLALSDSGLNESVTGALAVSPHNYANLVIDRNMNMKYQTEPVRVSDWAKQLKLEDPNLLNFASYSDRYFYEISLRRNLGRYEDLPELTDEELELLASFSAEINTSYFAGNVGAKLAALEKDPAFVLWKEKSGENPFRDYINSFLKVPQKNENEFNLSLRPSAASAK